MFKNFFKAIFVTSGVLASVWKVFIKFHWHGQNTTIGLWLHGIFKTQFSCITTMFPSLVQLSCGKLTYVHGVSQNIPNPPCFPYMCSSSALSLSCIPWVTANYFSSAVTKLNNDLESCFESTIFLLQSYFRFKSQWVIL